MRSGSSAAMDVPGYSLVAALVSMVAAFAVAEAVARWIEPALTSRPLLWHSRVVEGKVALMDDLRRDGRTGGTVIIGNSMALLDLRPTELLWPDVPFNAALHRGVPTLMERWVLEEVWPRLRPSRVVLGISVLDMNDVGEFHRAVTELYDEAPLSSAERRARRAVLRHCALARVGGHALRHPGEIVRAASRVGARPQPADALSDVIDRDGWGVEWAEAVPYEHTENREGWLRGKILGGYTAGGIQAAALGRLLRGLRQRGAQVVAVMLPVTDDFIACLPEGPVTYDHAVSTISAACAAAGVPLVDVTAGFHDHAYFADSFHLHGDGAARFSRLVSATVAGSLGGTMSASTLATRRGA